MSPSEETVMELVRRYLAGTATDEDCRELLAILNSNDANAAAVSDQIWVARLLGETARPALEPQKIMRSLPPAPSQLRAKTIIEQARLRQQPPLWTRPVWALAAAAGLLVLTGSAVVLLKRTPLPADEYAIGRITKRVGQVHALEFKTDRGAGTEVRTEPGSFCRVAQADHSVVALEENTRLAFERNDQADARTLKLETGRTFLDVTPQTSPLWIRAGNLTARILGTKILVSRQDVPTLTVLNGQVQVANGYSATILAASQTAVAFSSHRKETLLRITGSPVRHDQIAWLERLDMDPAAMLSAQPPAPCGPADSGIDWRNYSVMSGNWILDLKPDRISIVQSDETPNAQNLLVFGSPIWLRGRVACTFRVLKTLGTRAKISFVFAYDDSISDSCGSSVALSALAPLDSPIHFRVGFEVNDREDTMIVNPIEYWSERQPANVLRFEPGSYSPSGVLKQRGPCAVGVQVYNCTAEFTDLTLTDGVRDETVRTPGPQVRTMSAGVPGYTPAETKAEPVVEWYSARDPEQTPR